MDEFDRRYEFEVVVKPSQIERIDRSWIDQMAAIESVQLIAQESWSKARFVFTDKAMMEAVKKYGAFVDFKPLQKPQT